MATCERAAAKMAANNAAIVIDADDVAAADEVYASTIERRRPSRPSSLRQSLQRLISADSAGDVRSLESSLHSSLKSTYVSLPAFAFVDARAHLVARVLQKADLHAHLREHKRRAALDETFVDYGRVYGARRLRFHAARTQRRYSEPSARSRSSHDGARGFALEVRAARRARAPIA